MSSEEHHIFIDPTGTVRFVWDDTLANLCEQGAAQINRAGDVEPTPLGGWFADLRRIGGGLYGPYRLRKTALEHERLWVIRLLSTGMKNCFPSFAGGRP